MFIEQDQVRVAIVTAAAQGVGRAIALRLASDGLDVVISDLPSKLTELQAVIAEIRATGRKCSIIPGTMYEESDVENLMEAVVQEFGGVDVVMFPVCYLKNIFDPLDIQMVVNDGIGPSNPIASSTNMSRPDRDDSNPEYSDIGGMGPCAKV